MDVIRELLIICALIVAILKCLAYKLRLIAVLLYYIDRDFNVPSDKTIREYELRVAKAYLQGKREVGKLGKRKIRL